MTAVNDGLDLPDACCNAVETQGFNFTVLLEVLQKPLSAFDRAQ
jgi:hypothetical protein